MPQGSILISGTSAGLGAQLAQHYCDAGQTVIGFSRSPAPDFGARYTHHQIDITDDKAVTNLFRGFREEKSRIGLLIHCAAASHSSLAVMTPTETARSVVDTNVLGSFVLLRETIKHMKRHDMGRIVCVSSVNVPLGSVGASLYNASKAAIENLTYTLSNETRGDPITLNSIGVSVFADGTLAQHLSDKAFEDKAVRMNREATVSLNEVVHAIDFFASDLAASITNQTLYFGGIK